jgi:hypothetical protein
MVIAGTTMGAMLFVWGPWLLHPVLPLVDLAFEALSPSVRASLSIEGHGLGGTIRAEAFAVQSIVVGPGREFPPGAVLGRYEVTVAHALLPVLLAVGTALAWPVVRRREWPLRGAVVVALAIAWSVFTVAIVLAGHLEIGVLRQSGRAGEGFLAHPLLAAMILLESGGRWLGAFAAAFVAIRAGRWGARVPAQVAETIRPAPAPRADELVLPPVLPHLPPGKGSERP